MQNSIRLMTTQKQRELLASGGHIYHAVTFANMEFPLGVHLTIEQLKAIGKELSPFGMIIRIMDTPLKGAVASGIRDTVYLCKDYNGYYFSYQQGEYGDLRCWECGAR